MISRALGEYLEIKGSGHILASPYLRRTNGRIERYHRSIKKQVGLLVREWPEEAAEEIGRIGELSNPQRGHGTPGKVSPEDAPQVMEEAILRRRADLESRTTENGNSLI